MITSSSRATTTNSNQFSTPRARVQISHPTDLDALSPLVLLGAASWLRENLSEVARGTTGRCLAVVFGTAEKKDALLQIRRSGDFEEGRPGESR